MEDAPHRDTSALVTGGAQGLGLACAERLIAEGCRALVLADIAPEVDGVAADLAARTGADVGAIVADMGDTAAVGAMVGTALRRMGRVTALVNAAASTARGSVLDTTPEGWDRLMAVNARGPFFALQAVAKAAISSGHPACVVNILSITVHGGLPELAPYVASKAALRGVTKNAAHALAEHRIRVNGINVGWMDTPGEDAVQRGHHGRPEGWLEAAEAGTPFGRLVKPDDVARQVAFLLGPHSGVVTGSVMDFDQRVIGAYPSTG